MIPSLFGVRCFIIAAYLFEAAYLPGAGIIGAPGQEEEAFSPEGETGAATEGTPGGD